MSVQHLKVNERGMTRLLVTIPLAQRQGLAELSRALKLSQQALIRSSIAQLLAGYQEAESPTSDPGTDTSPLPLADHPEATLVLVKPPRSKSATPKPRRGRKAKGGAVDA